MLIVGFTNDQQLIVYERNGELPTLNLATFVDSIRNDTLRESILLSIKQINQDDYKAVYELIRPLHKPVVSPLNFFRKLQ